MEAASKFIDFVVNLDFKSIRNIKNTNWVIVSGFEIFSDKTINGKEALSKILNHFDIRHLESDKNYCTDLYRLCYAHDNSKDELEHRDLEKSINETKIAQRSYRPSRILNILRPFGIHKFRRIKYMFM